jgi:hypothetical protein
MLLGRVSNPGGASAVWRVKMDELNLKINASLAADEPGASLDDVPVPQGNPAPRSFSRVAEIITLDTSKNRTKTLTPNDPPNVPIDEHIGRHLKAIYDDVLNQPIPDRFLDLLNQLGNEPSKDEDQQ